MSLLSRFHPDYSILDEPHDFDALAQPFFRKGDETGCIVLHGIGGTPANVRVTADALAALGYTVFAPTLPGHGETVRAQAASTHAQWLACTRDAADRLTAEGCTRLFAVGLSLGGLLAGLLAEERALAGACLICAPVRMLPYLERARRLSILIPYVRYADHYSTPANPYKQMYCGFAVRKLRDLNRLRRRLIRDLAHIRCPLYLIQTGRDDKIDPVSAEIVRAGAVNAASFSLDTLEDALHGCTYSDARDEVAARVAAFIQAQVDKPTPERI